VDDIDHPEEFFAVHEARFCSFGVEAGRGGSW
jgi:hypothetical protein